MEKPSEEKRWYHKLADSIATRFSPSYATSQSELKAKRDELETIRTELETHNARLGEQAARISELENLANHLKEDKRNQHKRYHNSLRNFIDQGAIQKMEFMTRNEERTKHSCMFVNSNGTILGYTKALEVALGIKEDVTGKHYLDVFHFENETEDARASLKKYFSSPEEISVPYDRQDGKKTRKLTITKEKPVGTGEISLEYIKSGRPDKVFSTVAYVPIRVESRKRTLRSMVGASPKTQKAQQAYIGEVTINLIINHGWGSDQIDIYKVDHGEKGLISEYKRLEREAI